MLVFSTVHFGICLIVDYYVLFLFPDPVSLVRDHNIKEKLLELGITVQSYNGDLLCEPWEIYDESGNAFVRFDSFWDKSLHMQMEPVSHLPPWRLLPAPGNISMIFVIINFVL